MNEFWNRRYSELQYVYGKSPNEFLKSELNKLQTGKILFLGEGEGRNSVYAASRGWIVDAIDWSEEGKRKAEALAKEFGVRINYRVEDFNSFSPEENIYDAVGVFFIHLDEDLRIKLFGEAIKSLKPNGKIIFECFEKNQLGYSSGGPKDELLLYSLEDVVNEFIDLDFEQLSKEKVFLNEGEGHQGEGIVIRFIGLKPGGSIL